jgi:hypothetical protein
MSTAMNPPTADPKQANDWPEVIRLPIWLVREENNWQALAANFDVVGQGQTEALALQNLQELVIDYLDSCAEDGMTWAEVQRPIPREERLRLEFGRLLTPLRRLRHRLVTREGLIFPAPGRTAHC